jgi:shikimate kinase
LKGVGETTAAITIVNALPAGIGSAVGIDLPVRAEVELHPAGSHGKWEVNLPEESRTPLVLATLTEALRRFAPGSSGTGALRLTSEIPAARGLKSSSAVGTAIALAVAQATDAPIDRLEIARLSAAVSRAVGVSATGALDDALASLAPEIVVTDNRAESLLATYPVPANLGVALYVAPGTHKPAPELLPAFRNESENGRLAGALVTRGEWVGAMRMNTEIVERVIGYDYGGLRARLDEHGAVASGVSGLGPAFAAVGPRERLSEMLETLPEPNGSRRVVSFAAHRVHREGP